MFVPGYTAYRILPAIQNLGTQLIYPLLYFYYMLCLSRLVYLSYFILSYPILPHFNLFSNLSCPSHMNLMRASAFFCLLLNSQSQEQCQQLESV